MKRSRIICSIIEVMYILLSIYLIVVIGKSNIIQKSSLSVNIKAIYVAVFGICALMYVFVKNKLTKKLESKNLSRCYYYLYLAVVVFISRLVMAYILKNDEVVMLEPSFRGLGIASYINYGLAKLLKNQMYANIIINTVLVFISCILVKKIILKITKNDTLATITSIMYILLPQSLIYVNQYIRGNYNIVMVLSGILTFITILEELENFSRKSNMYLICSITLGTIAALDIVLGGAYILWLIILIFTTITAMYVDMVNIKIKFKDKFDYKLKIFCEKIERINISKLIIVALIVGIIALIPTVIYDIINVNNYTNFNLGNIVNILSHSRNYYLVLIIISVVFEIIGVILKRKLDSKIFIIKLAMIANLLLLAFTSPNIYAASLFDTMLVLTIITNICNICYNREEMIKLLKEKN